VSMRKASGVNEENSPSGNGPWRGGGGTFRMKRTRPAWRGRRERRALTAPDSAAGSPALSDWIRGARKAGAARVDGARLGGGVAGATNALTRTAAGPAEGLLQVGTGWGLVPAALVRDNSS
jgi:hypothetical protein